MHLNRCPSEFQFKWNHSKSQDIFVLVITALEMGSSLPYKALIAVQMHPKTKGRKWNWMENRSRGLDS